MTDLARTQSLGASSMFVTQQNHGYVDHYHDPVQKPGEGGTEVKRPRNGVVQPFPERLYELLRRTEAEGITHIISWQPHGRCFVVHKPKDFAAHVMPRYFHQTKYSSFRRQLNLYGFQRPAMGPDRGGYYHPFFLRGRPDLSTKIIRNRNKKESDHLLFNKDLVASSAYLPHSEPNFYSMEPCRDDSAPQLMSFSSKDTTSMPPYSASVGADGEGILKIGSHPTEPRCNSSQPMAPPPHAENVVKKGSRSMELNGQDSSMSLNGMMAHLDSRALSDAFPSSKLQLNVGSLFKSEYTGLQPSGNKKMTLKRMLLEMDLIDLDPIPFSTDQPVADFAPFDPLLDGYFVMTDEEASRPLEMDPSFFD